MELTQLAKEMLALEQQAAVVGRLLREADEELLEQVASAWAPLKPRSYQQRRWDAFWIAWLQECGDRVPVVSSRVDHGENWTCPEPLLRSHQHDDVIGCGV
jgi:hypothetical protein